MLNDINQIHKSDNQISCCLDYEWAESDVIAIPSRPVAGMEQAPLSTQFQKSV